MEYKWVDFWKGHKQKQRQKAEENVYFNKGPKEFSNY